jgi:hypothetical protein
VFGFADNQRITGVYDRLTGRPKENLEAWGGRASFSNILRAFVAHPLYSRTESVSTAVVRLENEQKADGLWPKGIPFYLTVNALAHLDLPSAERQIKRAFKKIRDTQSFDGSWGRTRPEWNTFLVVHALHRINLI